MREICHFSAFRFDPPNCAKFRAQARPPLISNKNSRNSGLRQGVHGSRAPCGLRGSFIMCLTCGFRRLPHVPCLCVFLVGCVCGSRAPCGSRAWVFLSCVSRVTSVGVWLSMSVSRAVRLMFTPTAPFHPATCHSSIFTSTASRALRIKPLGIRDLLEVLLQK